MEFEKSAYSAAVAASFVEEAVNQLKVQNNLLEKNLNLLVRISIMKKYPYDAKKVPPNEGVKDLDLLKLEYQTCNEGYNSRDRMTNDLFYKIASIFSIYITILVAINIFVQIDKLIHFICCSLLGVAGFISMLSLLVSLESVSSCKVALRKRCMEIEKIALFRGNLKCWKIIKFRDKFHIEKKIKGLEKEVEEPEGSYYVLTSKLLIL